MRSGVVRCSPASAPHRISHRLAARLLRLPLEGGVILERLMQAKNHSPLEGESARGRSPQSSRWGANAAPRAGPVSDYQRHGQRSLGGGVRPLEGFRQV